MPVAEMCRADGHGLLAAEEMRMAGVV